MGTHQLGYFPLSRPIVDARRVKISLRKRLFQLLFLFLIASRFWETNRPIISARAPLIVIVACAKSLPTTPSVFDSALLSELVGSVLKSTADFDKRIASFELLVAVDSDDHFWNDIGNQELVVKFAYPTLPVNFIAVKKARVGHIPFNQACAVAFAYGADYIVRVNDDTAFLSPGWATKGLQALQEMQPPNVGVVGPLVVDGNNKILTHDMVHAATHLGIFGTYYPKEFDNWWIDDWISNVYGFERTKPIPDWVIEHHITKHGTRYDVNVSQEKLLFDLIQHGQAKVHDHLLSNRLLTKTQILEAGCLEEVSPLLTSQKLHRVLKGYAA